MKRRIQVLVLGLTSGALAVAAGQVGYGRQRQTEPGAAASGAQTPAGRGGFRARAGLPPVIQPDEAYLQWPMLPSQQGYAKISGRHMKDMVKEIVAISEKSKADGNQYWGRIAGTPYDGMTRAWVVQQFKRIGLDEVRDQPVTQAPMWWPSSWDASVVAGGTRTALKTVFALGGASTPPTGIDVPIVWVGLGTAADFVGKDVRGKAALIYSIPTPSRREHSALWMGAIERARQAGARVVIIDLAIPGMPDVTTQPGVGGAEDAALDTLAISLGPGESDMVRTMIGEGQSPTLHFRMEVTRKTGPTGVVLGMLPGMTDENIVLEAHSDGFFYGAMDNASGTAQLIALAEYYAAIPRAQRRRNLIFVVNSDHHSGNAGLAWLRENLGAQLDKTVVDFNCEHPAQTQTYMISGGLMTSNMPSARRINVGGTNGTELLRTLIKKSFREFGVATYTRPDGGDGEGGGPFSTAAPRIGVIDHTFYHTTMDTIDFLPATGMEQSTRAYANIIDEVNKLTFDQVRKPKAPPATQNR